MSVAPGRPLTYTLTISNNTSLTLATVLVSDTLPTGAHYLGGGWLVGNTVGWTIPSLRAGEIITRQFVVTTTRSITNSSYLVLTKEGFGAEGSRAVVTLVEMPVAGLSAGNSSPTTLGQTTTFTATITSGENVGYTWDFGDGHVGSGRLITHTYQDIGHYTAVLTAANSVSSETAESSVDIRQDKWLTYLPLLFHSPASP